MRLTIAIVSAAFLLAATAASAEDATISGIARALDGDTISVGPLRVRLGAIDAPEAGQTCTRGSDRYACGSEATAFMRGLVDGRRVECEVGAVDKYRRAVGRCFALNAAGRRSGDSVNAQAVRAGWAIAFRRFGTEYVAAEDEAREARRGLWAGSFEMPEDVRAAMKGRP